MCHLLWLGLVFSTKPDSDEKSTFNRRKHFINFKDLNSCREGKIATKIDNLKDGNKTITKRKLN